MRAKGYSKQSKIIFVWMAVIVLAFTAVVAMCFLGSEPEEVEFTPIETVKAELAPTQTVAVCISHPVPTPTPTPVAGAVIEPEHEPTPEPTPTPVPDLATDADVELIARTIWGEAGGIANPAERAAVAWCILNRVDAWGQTIEEVVTAPYQFHGYITWGECPQEHIALAADVVERWEKEHAGLTDVGRVLPEEFMWFHGANLHNHFRNSYDGSYVYWDWSLESPYAEGGI